MVLAAVSLAVAGSATAQEGECVPPSSVELNPIRLEPVGYPEDAYLTQTEGYVVVTFNVAADGTVERLRIAESEPRGAFEHVVIQTVMGWQYERPVDRFGNSVTLCGKRQRFDFTLQE